MKKTKTINVSFASGEKPANDRKYATGNECYSNRKTLRKLSPKMNDETYDLGDFEKFIIEKGGLFIEDQKELYETGNLKKITVFLKYFYFHSEIQQRIVKANDLEVARIFLSKWRFAVCIHSVLVNFASSELWDMVIPLTKLCNEAEVNFSKKAPMVRLMHYRSCHEMCEKAENICRDVRKIKV